jgi:hypothetical protein
MRSRVTVVFVFVLLTFATSSPAQTQPRQRVDVLPNPAETARVEASVDRALEYLVRIQQPDGSWISGQGKNNGVNGVCLLAFLGRGHVPGRGPYRQVVDRAIVFLLATQDKNGVYRSPDPSHGPMYEHALATLAMIETYGYLPTDAMRASAQQAIDLIVKAQNPQGGWRYQPFPNDADLSVTVMQVVALRAAQNARLNVPSETIDGARQYVKSCVVPAGGFCYQPGTAANLAQSAAGTLSMQLLEMFDDPAVEKGLEYLHNASYTQTVPYFFYASYYAMQAAFQAGGEHWARWHPKVRALLLSTQSPDGSWPALNDGGEKPFVGETHAYSTAFAAMCLEVYMHYLPAYQR